MEVIKLCDFDDQKMLVPASAAATAPAAPVNSSATAELEAELKELRDLQTCMVCRPRCPICSVLLLFHSFWCLTDMLHKST